MAEKFIVSLPELALADVPRAGGKAACLGELIRAGLPVPPGFCITTAAYRRFVAHASLAERLEALLAKAPPSNPDALEKVALEVRSSFVAAAIPVEVSQAIERAYRQMGAPAVAVRSSATVEDQPEASFAGQHETFLNVNGLAEVLRHVQLCWASLWTARAIRYRHRLGINPRRAAMAVVVQELVSAEVSGVMFTINPNTGDRTESVINASFGLGEPIVSGLVTPDTYIVDRATLSTKQVVLGAKEVMVVPAEGGGTALMACPQGRRGERALDEPMVHQVAALGLRAEAHFGRPQDIEWACAGGKCVLLQSRPVTAA